jgi:putative Ca2+/H+ antiporter (TMEM165/GDT1 family)
MKAFIAAFIFVLLAEMGDKTQLLAMAFASRYSVQKVLLGVFLATVINHALAVFFGRFLIQVVPLGIISFIASLSFVIFGIWTLKGDQLKDGHNVVKGLGPVFTVAVAFFLAEMGDKTQLATIALAIKYRGILNVLIGTTLGMLAADAAGIIIGVILRRRIPEKAIKLFSAILFILFGLAGMYNILVR